MQLVAMRHGETDWNRCRRIQGQMETTLNQRGFQQVAESCRVLASQYSFTRIVSSPLLRARQSAMICKEYLRVPMDIAQEFSERTFGLLEGKTIQQIYKDYQISEPETILDSRFGMEPIEILVNRLMKGMERLFVAYSNETILLITHGSIIQRLAEFSGQSIGIIGNGEFLELEPLRKKAIEV